VHSPATSSAIGATRSTRASGRNSKGEANTRPKPRRRGKVRQAELGFRSWGGVRKGAGRKPKGERAGVAHISRPDHKARFPLLITSRLCPGLRSLRHEREAECLRRALAAANRAAAANCAVVPNDAPAAHGPGAARGVGSSSPAPFQVVHHSIQSNHLHLIVEADDRAALTSGMRGLLVRIARALNRLWKRSGPVFADRFHEHELRKPREVRNALVYVLQNLRKHGITLAGPDPLSSGPEFDGWGTGIVEGAGARVHGRNGSPRFGADRAASTAREACGASQGTSTELGGFAVAGVPSFLRAARAEVPRAKTWLLGIGWKTHGLIDPRESPRRP
jgi:putative transposase